MAKKKNKQQLDNEVKDLIDDINEDRARLVQFLDKLLSEHSDQPAGIAEYVAKLIDSSTKQLQTRASVIKSVSTDENPEEDDINELNDIAAGIGMPFANSDDKEDAN